MTISALRQRRLSKSCTQTGTELFFPPKKSFFECMVITMLVSHAVGERDQLLPVIKHKFAADPQICTEVLLT